MLSMFVLFAAAIWLIVAAFRVSILWGVAVFLIPFASLVFIVVHWQEAKAPFLAHIAGILLIVPPILAHPDVFKRCFEKLTAVAEAGNAPDGKKPLNLDDVLVDPPKAATPASSAIRTPAAPSDTAKQDQIELKRTDLTQLAAEMNARYSVLQAQRAQLQPGDAAAVERFNAEAARYSELRKRVEATKAALEALERSP
jgi:hypothetical protein